MKELVLMHSLIRVLKHLKNGFSYITAVLKKSKKWPNNPLYKPASSLLVTSWKPSHVLRAFKKSELKVL
jgi:hypothetical protein